MLHQASRKAENDSGNQNKNVVESKISAFVHMWDLEALIWLRVIQNLARIVSLGMMYSNNRIERTFLMEHNIVPVIQYTWSY